MSCPPCTLAHLCVTPAQANTTRSSTRKPVSPVLFFMHQQLRLIPRSFLQARCAIRVGRPVPRSALTRCYCRHVGSPNEPDFCRLLGLLPSVQHLPRRSHVSQPVRLRCWILSERCNVHGLPCRKVSSSLDFRFGFQRIVHVWGCVPDRFKSVTGPMACTLCPPGFYGSALAANSSVCTAKCPPNSNSTAGATAKSQCLCSPFYQGPAGRGLDCACCALCLSVSCQADPAPQFPPAAPRLASTLPPASTSLLA
jgi:hypothetical protein